MSRMSKRLGIWAGAAAGAAALTLLGIPALAQDDPAAEPPPTEFVIGFVDLAQDARFDDRHAYYMVPVRPWGRPVAGAELGIADALITGAAIGVNFSLTAARGNDVAELVAAVEEWVAAGVGFVGVDLPAAQLIELSDAVADLPVVLFNVSAHDDELRGASCRANVVHTIPSHRMMTDAMMQFLVLHRWTNILVLAGPSEADQQIVTAVRQSANQFGARIIDVRDFVLGTDPRNREQNNVALMTNGNYDVVYVADSDGEFARYVPYETLNPRPVVGSAGLSALAWHWSWERQGAPQLNDRFEDVNFRFMDQYDWAAWAAVRAVVQSVLRSQSTEFGPVRDYLLGERMNLDGSKGNPMSVRSWDHQMRQGIIIATGNNSMQLAPVEGFLHQTNDLDTLGVDAPQSACQF
ncbi:MAG: amino acid ABC transporter substrate-binding protein [Bauldia sp.]|nr:amino acid ABC transporter substrate-binding protein [Bauldia sp.]